MKEGARQAGAEYICGVDAEGKFSKLYEPKKFILQKLSLDVTTRVGKKSADDFVTRVKKQLRRSKCEAFHLHLSPPCGNISSANRQRNDPALRKILDDKFMASLEFCEYVIDELRPFSYSIENSPVAGDFFAQVPSWNFDPEIDSVSLSGFGTFSVRERILVVRKWDSKNKRDASKIRRRMALAYGYGSPEERVPGLPSGALFEKISASKRREWTLGQFHNLKSKQPLSRPGPTIKTTSNYALERGRQRAPLQSSHYLMLNGFPAEYAQGVKTFGAKVSGLCFPPPAARAVVTAAMVEYYEDKLANATIPLNRISHFPATSVVLCGANFCHVAATKRHPSFSGVQVCEVHYEASMKPGAGRCRLCSGVDCHERKWRVETGDAKPKALKNSAFKAWHVANVSAVEKCTACDCELCHACLHRNFTRGAFVCDTATRYQCATCVSKTDSFIL